MLKQIKKTFNNKNPLVKVKKVKGYEAEDKKGYYSIVNFIDTCRLFQSIKDISKIKFNKIITINISKLTLNSLHIKLLTNGLKNNNKIILILNITKFSCPSKAIFQFKNLILKLPNITMSLFFYFRTLEEWLCFLLVLNIIKNMKNKELLIFVNNYWKYENNLYFRFKEKTIKYKILNNIIKNNNKIKILDFKIILKNKFYINISGLKLIKNSYGNRELIGNGDIIFNLY